jgi:hypothetical protein
MICTHARNRAGARMVLGDDSEHEYEQEVRSQW